MRADECLCVLVCAYVFFTLTNRSLLTRIKHESVSVAVACKHVCVRGHKYARKGVGAYKCVRVCRIGSDASIRDCVHVVLLI